MDSLLLKEQTQAGQARERSVTGFTSRLDQEIVQLARRTSGIVIEGEPGVGKRHLAHLLHSSATHGSPGVFLELDHHTNGEELKVILFEEGRKRQEEILGGPIPRLVPRSALFVLNIHEFSVINQTRFVRFLIQNDAAHSGHAQKVLIIISTYVPLKQLLDGKMVAESLDPYLRRFGYIVIPPLRERKEDIMPLAETFLRESFAGISVHVPAIDASAQELLKNHDWVDNVRELKLLINEVAHNSSGTSLRFPDSFLDETEQVKTVLEHLRHGKNISLEESVTSYEKNIIRRALVRSDFDKSKAARLLGLTEKSLRYRLRKYDLLDSFGKRNH